MSIPDKDVKVLWGRSNDICSFPDCWTQLTFGNGAGLIGEMAHIVAESTDGPRGISPLNKRHRNSYENLILLCPTHHTGDIEKDPHLYAKVNARKVYLTIDPRWITTTTGFVYFRSGTAKLAGLGFLGHVGEETAIISPLVVGLPNYNDFSELEW
jgi:hypothetical protein